MGDIDVRHDRTGKWLTALELLMPSTGFILDTLGRLGLNVDERHGITVRALNGELPAQPHDGERACAMAVL